MGLAFAAVIVANALTGYVMLFPEELNLLRAAEDVRRTNNLQGLDIAIGDMVDDSGVIPQLLIPPQDDGRAWLALVSWGTQNERTQRLISIDPATSHILRNQGFDSTPLKVLHDLHVDLYAGNIGRWLMVATGVGAILLCLSGFVILRRRLHTLMSNPLRPADRWRGLHRWSGLVGMIVLLMYATTGLVLLVSILISKSPEGELPVPIHLGTAIGTLVSHPDVREGGELFSVMLPTVARPEVSITVMQRGAPPWSKFTTISFDATSGKLVRRIVPETLPVSRRLLEAARSLHMGLFDPDLIRFVYVFAALFPILVVVSGPISWLIRRRKHA